jgi:hypothetical protein
MDYIVTKRAKFNSISGPVNLPFGTAIQEEDGVLYFEGNPLCVSSSQNAYDHFARNDDGFGLERGKLTAHIIKTLSKRDKKHQERWDKVWDDILCQKYKRPEHADYWLWSHLFYNAPIEDLRYIANLVKGVS